MATQFNSVIEPLVAAISKSLESLQQQAELVGLNNVDESTFRSYVMTEIKRLLPDAILQSEWNRIDLFLRNHGNNAVVEFKFYVQRRHIDPDGKERHWKGAAGDQNSREFRACISKLRALESPSHRFIVLVFEDDSGYKRRHSFFKTYGGPSIFDLPASAIHIVPCTAKNLACRIIDLSDGASTHNERC